MTVELALETIGLSTQEIKVYLSAMRLGQAKASEIALNAGIKREAAYYVLKTLQEKGFIGSVLISGVRFFTAASPERLLELVDTERERKHNALADVMSSLTTLHKTAFVQPTTEVYSGANGFKTIIAKLLEHENITIYGYVPEKTLHSLPSTFHQQFRRKRKEKNIGMKVITSHGHLTKTLVALDKSELRVTRFSDSLLNSVDALCYILPNALILCKSNEHEQLGIYIKDRSLAQLQKNIFEQLWKTLKNK